MKENLFAGRGVKRVNSGTYINLITPSPNDIHIEDVIHGLKRIPRFNGHTAAVYTVLEHSVDVYERAKRQGVHGNNFLLCALLHDASEAYLCDIPSPLKRELPDYEFIEARFMAVVSRRFGFSFEPSAALKNLDRDALVWEWENVVLRASIWRRWFPGIFRRIAERKFRKIFKKLSNTIN